MLIGTFLMKEENSAYNCHLVTCWAEWWQGDMKSLRHTSTYENTT
jgi:hypothetical protein